MFQLYRLSPSPFPVTLPHTRAPHSQYKDSKGMQAKLKTPQQLQEMLDMTRELLQSLSAPPAAAGDSGGWGRTLREPTSVAGGWGRMGGGWRTGEAGIPIILPPPFAVGGFGDP